MVSRRYHCAMPVSPVAASAAASGAVSYAPAIITATAGLLGVLLGGVLTTLKDVFLDWRQSRREAQYLAILVSNKLGLYANTCLAVARDDGYEDGPWGNFPERSAQVKLPEFNPLDMDVEWKSLPPDLLSDIFDIPWKADNVSVQVAFAAENDPDPTDQAEVFWLRREGWAQMGLDVSAIVKRLRRFAKLPIEQASGLQWTREKALHEALAKVNEERRSAEERIAAARAARVAAGETLIL
jgi:hypothetical protein